MTTADRRLVRAVQREREILEMARRELHATRRSLGLSRRELGTSVGVSDGEIARFEKAVDLDVQLGRLARIATGLGLAVSLRFYPEGEPIRDAGHLRLERRLHARMAPTVRWQTEVPLVGTRDLRAWDAVATGTGCTDAFEFETRIGDLQATERRLALKLRDDQAVEHLFLVLADTRHTRHVIRVARDRIRETFPLDTREALGAFGEGRCPRASGLVIL
jgi:transcriptional regulator with XRE-family HTH domain